MFSYNITAQEMSDYYADMADIAADALFLSDESMDEMAAWYGEV